jgi:hypothetical protein
MRSKVSPVICLILAANVIAPSFASAAVSGTCANGDKKISLAECAAYKSKNPFYHALLDTAIILSTQKLDIALAAKDKDIDMGFLKQEGGKVLLQIDAKGSGFVNLSMPSGGSFSYGAHEGEVKFTRNDAKGVTGTFSAASKLFDNSIVCDVKFDVDYIAQPAPAKP